MNARSLQWRSPRTFPRDRTNFTGVLTASFTLMHAANHGYAAKSMQTALAFCPLKSGMTTEVTLSRHLNGFIPQRMAFTEWEVKEVDKSYCLNSLHKMHSEASLEGCKSIVFLSVTGAMLSCDAFTCSPKPTELGK